MFQVRLLMTEETSSARKRGGFDGNRDEEAQDKEDS